MTSQTISSSEANRLYWLGRYAERAYLSLHMLRKCCDQSIDGDQSSFALYDRAMGIDPKDDAGKAHLSILYDRHDPASLISSLQCAKDNAIVLRSYISSEALSYIEMAMVRIEEAAKAGETNITTLQAVTDNLMSFWGSLTERVTLDKVSILLVVGRMLEYTDMHIRFMYPFARIDKAYKRLISTAENIDGLVDYNIKGQLDRMLTGKAYDIDNDEYRFKALKFIGQLVRI